MKCPNCEKEYKRNYKICPSCKFDISNDNDDSEGKSIYIDWNKRRGQEPDLGNYGEYLKDLPSEKTYSEFELNELLKETEDYITEESKPKKSKPKKSKPKKSKSKKSKSKKSKPKKLKYDGETLSKIFRGESYKYPPPPNRSLFNLLSFVIPISIIILIVGIYISNDDDKTQKVYSSDLDSLSIPPTSIPPTPMPPTSIPPTPMPPTSIPPTPMPPPPLPPTPTQIAVLSKPKIENDLSDEELVNKNMELKLLALNLINEKRLKNGLNKLELGINPVAQIFAEDSAKYEHDSFWMLNGEKTYQIYSSTGGTSSISTTQASGGWTKEEWESKYCSSINVYCDYLSAEELIYEQIDRMNEPNSNTFEEEFLSVNIGIASNELNRFHGLLFIFETGHFSANLEYKNDYLSMVIYNNTYKYNFSDSAIRIYYDPLPESIANSDGKHPEKYETGWTGGGYEKCGIDDCLVADIGRPPKSGFFYSDLEPKDVIASKWEIVTSNPNVPSDKLTVQANLSNIKLKPGIYSVLVWGDNIENGEPTKLIHLTFSVDR